MPDIVKFNHMRVGQKGGGKHWTEAEVNAREAASKKFERKKKPTMKIPGWLNDEARKVWRKTVKDMAEFEVLDKVDEDVLGAYCDAVAKYQDANRLIDIEGYTEINAQGNMVVSAYVKMAQSYSRIILSYSNKLGLNAEARARLAKKTADQEEDENAGLFD
ncbi:P27 family predicted phage terminase small subunit [Paenibacillus sp. PastF-3]|uniref:phage terminase small subunit P27 family n=1 Tax=unclassified Paenibacillus TaxID=185978 RepID=UPI002475C3CB|nr:phage terminase small subunit P27 family [Paenibacillus sp. PastF-3]MDH6370562.1 P27 family predicted phage terminase small subunit [Paenibacillus sp. PastF-3]